SPRVHRGWTSSGPRSPPRVPARALPGRRGGGSPGRSASRRGSHPSRKSLLGGARPDVRGPGRLSRRPGARGMAGLGAETRHELYTRGTRTLLASWEQYASGAVGAAVDRIAGVSVAVFPHPPERAVYNNALLDRDLEAADRRGAAEAMAAAYREAGVDRYAAWVHESDEPMQAELGGRGYTISESTHAMGMAL